MEPKAATKDPVGAIARTLVQLAEDNFADFREPYSELCDMAHAVDELALRLAAAEQRAAQAESRLFAVALVLRP